METKTYTDEGVKAIASTAKPIPGQSLTNNPDTPYIWEGAPEHTNFREAFNDVLTQLMIPDTLKPILQSINDGVPIMDLAQQILYVGFREGKFNPDLMLMLAEPLAYALMYMSENAGIKFRIDSDDGIEATSEEDDEIKFASLRSKNIKRLKKQKEQNKNVNISNRLDNSVIQRIDNADLASLLNREEVPEEEPVTDGSPNEEQSLLAQDEQGVV